jgi:hypothetical protein
MGYKFHRTDGNHTEIIQAYEALFCSVLELHRVGEGCPDLLVGIQASANDLVEVKSEAGHLGRSQLTFQRNWRGAKVIVVRSVADVLHHVKNVRERLSRRQG